MVTPSQQIADLVRGAPALVLAEGLDLELARYPLTDLGNAERFAKRYGAQFRYVSGLGWLAWDGRRWVRDGSDELMLAAVFKTVRNIQDEAKALRSTGEDEVTEERKGKPFRISDAVAKWGRASEAATKIKAIQVLAAPKMAIPSALLDADPWKINVLNGTLHIRRRPGEEDPIILRPHEPSDLITKLAPVEFQPEAVCPHYDRFLREVQPEAEMRRFLHQWGGYSLTGDTTEQRLCFLYGRGRNGKSTLVDIWGTVAGDYGKTVPIETFLDHGRGRNAGQATPDLALLPGVRLLRTSEPEKGAKLAEALIKLVTGGEPIQARNLNEKYSRFRPEFKLTMSGNYRPQIAGTDEGIWRRLVLVPWNVTVAEPDKGLPGKLVEETAGVLNRLLDGLRHYLDRGMIWPDTVTEATQAYRDDSDPLGRFLAAAVASDPACRVQSSVLHDLFCAWAKWAGEREWTQKGFSKAMQERGYTRFSSQNIHWLGIRLTKSRADFDTQANPPRPSSDGEE